MGLEPVRTFLFPITKPHVNDSKCHARAKTRNYFTFRRLFRV